MQTTCVPEHLRPKIEFPAKDYPLKIIGEHLEDYRNFVEQILIEQKINYSPDSIQLIPSSNKKYLSLRLTILAESEQQLANLHKTLLATKKIIMVL